MFLLLSLQTVGVMGVQHAAGGALLDIPLSHYCNRIYRLCSLILQLSDSLLFPLPQNCVLV